MKKIWIRGEKGMLSRFFQAEIAYKYSVVNFREDLLTLVSTHHKDKEFDVCSDKILEEMQREKPDYVVHFAAVVGTDKCVAFPKTCIKTNLEGTQNVLDACQKTNTRLLYIDTTVVYNRKLCAASGRAYTEESELKPETIYGITKYAGELLVTNQKVVKWVVVRPCFLLGSPPFDHSSQVCKIAMHDAIKKYHPHLAAPRLKVTLNPRLQKDYLAVEDFVRAIRMILDTWQSDKKRVENQVFNTSSHDIHTAGAYFKMLHSHYCANEELDMSWAADEDYLNVHLVDSTKLRRAVGWVPLIPIQTKIANVYTEARKYVRSMQNVTAETFNYK